jgi:hypothetical protein
MLHLTWFFGNNSEFSKVLGCSFSVKFFFLITYELIRKNINIWVKAALMRLPLAIPGAIRAKGGSKIHE